MQVLGISIQDVSVRTLVLWCSSPRSWGGFVRSGHIGVHRDGSRCRWSDETAACDFTGVGVTAVNRNEGGQLVADPLLNESVTLQSLGSVSGAAFSALMRFQRAKYIWGIWKLIKFASR